VSIQIEPLTAEHLEAAAGMVAERYRAARAEIPMLPAAYVAAGAVAPRLQVHIGHVPGVVALDAGRPVGFIMSLLVSNRAERMAYVPDFAHGAETGRKYELYRLMYAEIADQWLANGCFMHGITLYPQEQAASASWFSVGFGLTVMDALRVVKSPGDIDGQSRPTDLELRRASPEDVDLVTALEYGLVRHLSSSPAFLPLVLEERRRSLEDWIADQRHALWIVVREDEAVAHMRFEPSEQLVLPTSTEKTVAITGAFTRKDSRGVGIGTTLLQTGLHWAHTLGYTHCSVDFESANLAGSAFWLRHFAAVTHSLVRRVDSRLAWANARRDEVDLVRSFEGHTWIG
jgi:GNAT superfamily N-acetyltransferase